MNCRPLTAILLSLATCSWLGAEESLSISGTWRFALDRDDEGVAGEWFHKKLSGRIHLPGSLQEQGFGNDISVNTHWTGSLNDRSWFTAKRYAPYRRPGNVKVPFWLQPQKEFVGAAWYQRDVDVPESWRGKRIVLCLERLHWGTRAWLDDRLLGERDGLSTPHEYDLGTEVPPGKRRLTIRVDNRVLVPVGINAHSVSDHTQGNWNGITGDLRLYATEPVWIDDVQVFPDVAARAAHVKVRIGNQSGRAGSGRLRVSVESLSPPGGPRPPAVERRVEWQAEGAELEIDCKLGKDALLWDEFHPALYRLTVEVPGVASPRTTTFGLREIKAAGKSLLLNGRRIFLRGTLECCIFPLHGYPPTDVASWKRVLRVARSHGLNHLRFHSWCPPEAAFTAADEMGFYYQVESAAWAHVFNKGTALDTWIYAETGRILREYGNHPSLMFLAASNEPGGPRYQEFLARYVEHWKARDPRRLYTAGSGWPSIPQNQYHVTPRARGFPVRAKLGETAGDYRDFLARQTAPIVSHEIGQYCVFPDLGEIPRYTGLLKARNFEIVRDFLQAAGMAGQARDFLRASGRLQALFYKDEIEACLRTPGWSGFQLLDLHDFPGQGTALVGVLNAFWGEKGYIQPEEFRRFCSETVPLARLPRRIWTSDETFTAEVDVAHFGEEDLKADVRWRIRSAAGATVASGRFSPRTLVAGRLSSIGKVEMPLDRFRKASALNLDVSLEGTQYGNDWNFWVYPPQVETAAPRGVLVARQLDANAARALEDGGRVLLLPDPRSVRGRTRGRFDPIFWNKLWFPSQPQHTLGLLMDPAHPALAEFPTTFHADWQWQDIQNRSRPVVLDGWPKDYRPLVQVIDDWNTCRKLGLVFEARVGKGRLLVCAADLEQDLESRPSARQLRASLLDYAASDRFQPEARVDMSRVRALFRDLTLAEKLGARVIGTDSAERGYGGKLILDGDASTMWHTAWSEGAPGFPHHVVISLARTARIGGVLLLPRQDGNRNGWIRDYAIYASDDGKSWGDPVAHGRLSRDASEKEIRFPEAVSCRFLKLVALASFDEKQSFASLAELTILPPQK